MQRHTASCLMAVAGCVGLLACGGGQPPQAAAEGPAAAPTKKEITYAPLTIEKYGLTMEAPVNAKAHEAGANLSIWSDDTAECSSLLGELPPSFAKMQDYEAEIKDAKRMAVDGVIKQWIKQEKRPDGTFALEWAFDSVISKEPQWGVQYRLILGGKIFQCGSSTSRSPESAACVARMCTSLKAI